MLNPLSYISKLIKSTNQRELDRISKIVNKINSLEESIKNLESSAFPKKTLEFKEKLKSGTKLDQLGKIVVQEEDSLPIQTHHAFQPQHG